MTIGQVKRALEWWSCSENFRQLVATDPERAGREYHLGFNADLIRPLWDPSFAQEGIRERPPTHQAVQAYREFFDARTEWRAQIKRECSPADPRFKAWRARQVARTQLESAGNDDDIIHAPIAIELTDGCSVGCWFCGVGATSLVEVWRYTDENAALWRDVLSVLREKIGHAARWGFCYWATDPLDNPDYERFALAFSDIVGMFPQTTTAQGHTDPARIRSLLRMSAEGHCRLNRFSVLTEPLLRRIYDEYAPDELTDVEIVPQMRGGAVPKADTGAFRLLAQSKRKVLELERRKLDVMAQTALPGTIACVSGFLLNMVKRSVKLVSPCRATDGWPLGYIAFDERTFNDAESLGRQLEAMIESHMPCAIDPEDRMRLNPTFSYERVADGFNVATPTNALAFRRGDTADYLRSIGDQLHDGQKTASQIAFSVFFEHGVPEVHTLRMLQLLFERGLLVDAKGRIAGDHRVADAYFASTS